MHIFISSVLRNTFVDDVISNTFLWTRFMFYFVTDIYSKLWRHKICILFVCDVEYFIFWSPSICSYFLKTKKCNILVGFVWKRFYFLRSDFLGISMITTVIIKSYLLKHFKKTKRILTYLFLITVWNLHNKLFSS